MPRNRPMTPDAAAALVAYGPVALGLWVALGCAAVPVPVWPMLMLAGALAGTGAGLPLLAAALAGAMLGDAAGHALGRRGGRLRAALLARPRVGPVLAAAEARLAAHAGMAVFVTRWLAAPLGPAVNLAAGAAGLPLAGLWPAALAGRVVWVAGYGALGWVFAGSVQAAGGVSAVLAALAAAGWLAVLWRRQRRAAVSATSQARNAASGGQSARAAGQTSQ